MFKELGLTFIYLVIILKTVKYKYLIGKLHTRRQVVIKNIRNDANYYRKVFILKLPERIKYRIIILT